jgi:hypothetical protein
MLITKNISEGVYNETIIEEGFYILAFNNEKTRYEPSSIGLLKDKC